MKVMELYLQAAKNEPPQSVLEMTLIDGFGAQGDCHGGGKRQLSLWDYDAREQVKALEYCGLCMKKFSVNIMLSGLAERVVSVGDTLKTAGVEIEITLAGKSCFPDDCAFAAKTSDCPVQRCAYARVARGGIVKVGDEFVHISGN